MEATGQGIGYPYGLKISKKVQRAIYKKEKRMTPDERKLVSEIGEAYREMTTTYAHFECATDPQLIEYYTYQYKADQIRYGYLIRCMKKIYYSKSG